MSHIHLFKPGAAVTFDAASAITAQRLVEVTGNREVSTAGVGSTKVVGAAATDAAEGERVLVLRGGVQELIASSAIAAGDRVDAAADGKIAKATGTGIGLALTGAAANAAAQIALD
jgi:predicted RecA/RadA family phage recombinase